MWCRGIDKAAAQDALKIISIQKLPLRVGFQNPNHQNNSSSAGFCWAMGPCPNSQNPIIPTPITPGV